MNFGVISCPSPSYQLLKGAKNMKPGGVVSFKKINAVGFLFKNKLHLLMFVSLVIGIVIGSFFFTKGGNSELLFKSIFEFFVSSRKGKGFFTIFISSFLTYLIACGCYFVVGASIIGVVLSPILCCTFGIYFSGIAAFAYSNFALKGVAFNAIIILPTALSFFVCAFFAAKEAFGFSSIIIKLTLPKSRPLNISGEFRVYCGKFLIILLLCLISAIIDSAVSMSFLGHFSF